MNRREILFNYDSLIEQVDKKKQEFESGQINLFSNKQKQTFMYIKKMEWAASVRLEYEKLVIGFYLSGHPMDHLKPFIKVCGCGSISSITKKEHKASVCTWGILNDFREVMTRKGVPMAFARLEDGTGVIETVFFSDVYLKFEKQIRSVGEPLVIKGTLAKEENTRLRLLVQEVELVRNQLNNRSSGIILQISEKEKHKLSALKEVLSQYAGSVPIYFNVKLENPSKVVCLKSSTFPGVALSSQFLEQIQKMMGDQDKVRLY